MKVLFVHDGKMSGHGLDLVVEQQLRALGSAGIPVTLVARGPSRLPCVQDRPMRLTPANLLSWAPSADYYCAQQRWLGWRAARLLDSGHHDLVLAWQRCALEVFTRARQVGIPRVLCSASAFAFKDSLEEVPRWPRMGNAHLRGEYNLANMILAPSERAAETYVQQGLPATKVRAIGRGFDPAVFYPSNPTPPGFRVLFCGRLCRRKGVEQILRSWDAAALASAELWLVGSVDHELDDFLSGYRDRPGIRFLGFRANVAELMRQCHAHIMLSSVESMGKSLIEAAACGLVNITTNQVGFPVVHKKDGLIVERDNPASIRQALELLYSDPRERERMARNAFEKVHAHHQWSHMHQRFLQALREAADQPGQS